MKYQGKIRKSRTYDYAALLAIMGAALQTLPMLQEQLSGYYGYIFMSASVITAYLRSKTTGPVGEK